MRLMVACVVCQVLARPAFAAQGPQVPIAIRGTAVVASARLAVGKARIDVAYAAGSVALSHAQIEAWVARSAGAVAAYYGAFHGPVLVLVVPGPRDDSGLHGTTWGDVLGYVALIRMTVGAVATVDELRRDWVMTHELTHTQFPDLEERFNWLQEGMATYVEPIARVHAGDLTEADVFADIVRDMPKGEPGPGDAGLAKTSSWARTYWGGALFCLEADVLMRERTENRFGLRDALRAIADAKGTIDHDWAVSRVIEVGDGATGTNVLAELYERAAMAPHTVDLPGIWKRLGVRSEGDRLVLDDAGAGAAVRRAIMRP